MFLGSPFVTDLDQLTAVNLFINDLPIHDFSRDILLCSSEYSDNLNKHLEEEIEKSKLLENDDICAKCDGMEIVALLNNLFGMFDHLSDKHLVYKVETVKDSFVGVAGAPEKTEDHAERIADMLLDMKDSVEFLPDPRPEYKNTNEHIKIGLGAHSGSVVAGIIGNKCPRYCLFGDAMNTSSRMMSSGEEQRIHISK
ncbi:E4.6.1.2 [Lepeophtheirus salmonis]|uniref:guanylate cyclase n=1 Tax=Lepeophtheirus salmonis TaxID=72036 RepID=A0A7R8CKJ9_LEPSM|nr:E4.6.1.2 [Lepeophtheirus salmonis]CAF2848458.1 E4.6.1.2 [Lepeophtheirus salmonis]